MRRFLLLTCVGVTLGAMPAWGQGTVLRMGQQDEPDALDPARSGTFAGRILSFTEHAATLCAAMHVSNPRSERDAMIAATALEHGMTVVTRNVADFAGTGVQLVNPFTS